MVDLDDVYKAGESFSNSIFKICENIVKFVVLIPVMFGYGVVRGLVDRAGKHVEAPLSCVFDFMTGLLFCMMTPLIFIAVVLDSTFK